MKYYAVYFTSAFLQNIIMILICGWHYKENEKYKFDQDLAIQILNIRNNVSASMFNAEIFIML